MPFVYEATRAHYPWLDMRVGSELRIVDTGSEGLVQGKEGKAIARCAGGSFFAGLGRPWMGLHTIDTVRRDAAGQGVWFETKYGAGLDKAEVVVTCDKVKLVYGIDMERDVIERITFLVENNGDHDVKGKVSFSYLQEISPTSHVFAVPRVRSTARTNWDRLGIIWLTRLAEGKLK